MFLLKMIDTAEAYLGAKVSDAVVNQLTTAFCSWCSLRRKNAVGIDLGTTYSCV